MPFCGETPDTEKYNVQYVYQTPAPGLTQRELAIVIGAVGGGVVIAACSAGTFLWIRFASFRTAMSHVAGLHVALSANTIMLVVTNVQPAFLCFLRSIAISRYKRTTRRMAKFSSLSRGLPDALLEGEGQEVAV